MKRIILIICCCLVYSLLVRAQLGESMYGEAVKADVKMKYVYSFEEALKKARKENKLIFFNCFADWALPCHGMNKAVFSNQEFADWMDQHFVNFIIDVTSPEGKPLAEKYHITFQAHYLVLDQEGEIVHRIVGGAEIPDFKAKLQLALNPKTSQRGMAERYQHGERGQKFLRDYALILRTADDKEGYEKVLDEYFTKASKSNWSRKETWNLFRDKVTKPEGEMYDYLVAHKAEFVKNMDAEKVDMFIVWFYLSPLYSMATGAKPYDGAKILDMQLALQKAKIPEEHVIFTIYEIARLRGEGKFAQLMDMIEQKVPAMDERTATGLDFSLKALTEGSSQKRERVVNYLVSRAEGMKGKTRQEYQTLIKGMVNPEGIQFVELPFGQALEQAKKEGKLLFIDCYTSWCGPCKMMSNQVFTQKMAGDFFNTHFVNLKMDMEKGEGLDLQKRYDVEAFPTMMLLDGEGRVAYKILGGCDAEELLTKIQRGITPEACYYLLKEQYRQSERGVNFMANYLLTMGDAGELKNPVEEIRNYLSTLKPEEMYTLSAWKLYDFIIRDFKMPEFQFVCKNQKLFAANVGQGVVEQKMEQMVFPVMIAYLKGEITREDVCIIRKLMTEAKLSENSSLYYLDRVVSCYEKKELGQMMDFYESSITEITDARLKLNLDVLLGTCMKEASVTEKERALTYVKACVDNADPRALRAYKDLLGVLSE